jgi:hypothetical protein
MISRHLLGHQQKWRKDTDLLFAGLVLRSGGFDGTVEAQNATFHFVHARHAALAIACTALASLVAPGCYFLVWFGYRRVWICAAE